MVFRHEINREKSPSKGEVFTGFARLTYITTLIRAQVRLSRMTGSPTDPSRITRISQILRETVLDSPELAGRTTPAKERSDQTLARYPEWLNRGAAGSSATTTKT